MYLQLYNNVHNEFTLYYDMPTNKIIDYFGPIKKVNIFVGANNSGKSRFMRALIKNQKFVFTSDKGFFDMINELIKLCETLYAESDFNCKFWKHGDNIYIHDSNDQKLKGLFDEFFPAATGTFEFNKNIFKDVENTLIKLKENLFKNDIDGYKNSLKNSLNYLNFMIGISCGEIHDVQNTGMGITGTSSILSKVNLFENLKSKLNTLDSVMGAFSSQPKKIYIPILRTALALIEKDPKYNEEKATIQNDIYKFTMGHYYQLLDKENVESNNIEIFTGLELYKLLKKEILHEREEIVDRVKEFCAFLSKAFFENKEIDLRPIESNDHVSKRIKVRIKGEIDRNLYDLGDGINSIIILMYRLFTAEDRSWIFIEEPEQNLHPAFQRIFLETILNNDTLKIKDLKIFFTTHSNHLLDISIPYKDDISIFTFEKIMKGGNEIFYLENVKSHDLRILELLGINNSSVFMSNCSIWVEGVTDRKYLEAYLKAFYESSEFNDKKKYLEDLHFSFLEYSGSNIEHYVFDDDETAEDLIGNEHKKIKAKFIANKIFLLSDKDKGKETKHTEKAKQISENMEYHITEGKEIENLISPDLLKKCLIKFSGTFNNESVEKIELKESEYLNLGLGHYLDKKFSVKVSESSGTLTSYYKNKLADYVSEEAIWENMSENAKELTRELYNFIDKSNKH